MKKIALVALLTISGYFAKSQIFIGNDQTTISFFSHTSMEDIEAKNTTSKPVLDGASGKFAIQSANKGYIFKSGLMQEHFNENYMESEKFQYSTFKGAIPEKVDYSKDGITKITMVGKMDMHGVIKDVKIPATLTVKGDQITIDAKFPIAMKDYEIHIPEAVGNKFAEAMEVTVHAVLIKKK
jgi:hypothetical protein